jgi:hypothetical protein
MPAAKLDRKFEIRERYNLEPHGPKRKARQFDLTSLVWFEPELWSGVSGDGHKDSQRG